MLDNVKFIIKMERKIKRIDIKEFREKGYLQELNRCFLHPLGLALEVVVDDTGNEKLGGIWDYRDDDEGIHYGLKNSDKERILTFLKKREFVNDQFSKKMKKRYEKLGFHIEPIESYKPTENPKIGFLRLLISKIWKCKNR